MARFALFAAASLLVLAASQEDCAGAECPGNVNLLQVGYNIETAKLSGDQAKPAQLSQIKARSPTMVEKAAEGQSEWKEMKVFAGPEVTLGKKGQVHGQCAQDWIAASLLGCKSGGFFVDLAANEASIGSNSLMLERDFAWNGLCIEANMDYMYGLSHRKCQVVSAAVGGPRDQKVEFAMKRGLGGIVGDDFDNKKKDAHTETLFTVPLGDILDEMKAPTQIEFLSLDVEGAESLVMKGFAWDKYRFSVIIVERPKPDLQKALSDNGYRFLRFNSNWNDQTWIDTKLPNFAELMADWVNKKSGFSKACMIEKGYPVPPNFFNDPTVKAKFIPEEEESAE